MIKRLLKILLFIALFTPLFLILLGELIYYPIRWIITGIEWAAEPYLAKVADKIFDNSNVMIDYKELLEKYMNHVSECEGSDFIYHINKDVSSVEFTEDEIKALKEL